VINKMTMREERVKKMMLMQKMIAKQLTNLVHLLTQIKIAKILMIKNFKSLRKNCVKISQSYLKMYSFSTLKTPIDFKTQYKMTSLLK
jgi:hypothetical protein